MDQKILRVRLVKNLRLQRVQGRAVLPHITDRLQPSLVRNILQSVMCCAWGGVWEGSWVCVYLYVLTWT